MIILYVIAGFTVMGTMFWWFQGPGVMLHNDGAEDVQYKAEVPPTKGLRNGYIEYGTLEKGNTKAWPGKDTKVTLSRNGKEIAPDQVEEVN